MFHELLPGNRRKRRGIEQDLKLKVKNEVRGGGEKGRFYEKRQLAVRCRYVIGGQDEKEEKSA